MYGHFSTSINITQIQLSTIHLSHHGAATLVSQVCSCGLRDSRGALVENCVSTSCFIMLANGLVSASVN